MLVEINLLPKKEPKNYALIAILLIALFLFLVAGSYLVWQGASYQSKVDSLNQQIVTTKKLTEAKQAEQGRLQANNSISELVTAMAWANEEPLKAVPIINHVTAMLPNRGFIQNISYAETGTVSLTVQFDTSRDAAYYLKTLLGSEWFEEVTLSSITASEQSTEEKKEETNEKPAQENESSSEGTNSSETQETEENTETKAVKATENEFVPRYIGQYQLTLNRGFINEKEKAVVSTSPAEGGEGS